MDLHQADHPASTTTVMPCTASESPNRSAISLRQDDSCSLDHLVGALLQKPRHLQPERLGGLEIDDELELGRPDHG